MHLIGQVTHAVSFGDGEVHRIEWKATAYADGSVYAQLREILLQVLDRTRCKHALDVGDFAKGELFFRQIFDNAGLIGDAFIPSVRMTISRDAPLHPKTRQEHQLRADGVFATLAHYSLRRHMRSERARAEASAIAALESTELTNEMALKIFNAAVQAAAPRCVAGQSSDGICAHLWGHGLVKDKDDNESPAKWLVGRMKAACEISSVCRAAFHVFGDMITACGCHFSNVVLTGKYEYRVLKADLLRQSGSKKRMRIDEDFKVALANNSSKKGIARSGRQMARCIDDNVQGSTVAEWETCNLGAQIRPK